MLAEEGAPPGEVVLPNASIWRSIVAEKYVVAKADEVPEGERIIVDVQGESIGVFHHEGAFYAIRNRCPHQGAELCKGLMVGLLESERPGQFRFDMGHKLLVCPWHGWEFDLRTGQSYFDPQRTRVRRFPVEVQDGEQVTSSLENEQAGGIHLAAGPYKLDLLPIAVEGEYLVVTLRG